MGSNVFQTPYRSMDKLNILKMAPRMDMANQEYIIYMTGFKLMDLFLGHFGIRNSISFEVYKYMNIEWNVVKKLDIDL